MQIKKQRDRCTSVSTKSDLTLEIAFHYTEAGDHSSALKEYQKNLDLWRSKDDRIQCAVGHRLIADCCIELGEFDQAIKHTNEYLKLSVETNNKLEQQRAFVTLGRCFLNRAEHLKDGADVLKAYKSASQAFLNSIKLIGELDSGLSAEQLGEMRAVSLLNLGQVLRSIGDHRSSNERFLQCISLARKYHLPKLLFRASYQVTDLILCTYRDKCCGPCSKSSLLEQRKNSSLRHALDIVGLALRSPISKTCSDSESKELLKTLKETYAAIHLSLGNFRKASKVYRLLKLHSPSSSNTCRMMIKKSMLLSKELQSLPDHVPESVDEHLLAARKHEQLGDIFSQLELNGLALNHYQFMLTHAESAYHLGVSTNSTDTSTLTKLMDAALVSVAETFRALNDYSQCVQTYKREIQWVTSTGLPTTELASSWFSMAQAQRLCFPSGGSSIAPSSSLTGSDAVLEMLKHALQASKQSDTPRLTLGILTELEDYYICHDQPEEAASIRREIAEYKQSRRLHPEEETEGDDEEEEEDQSAGKDTVDESDPDEDVVTQYIDSLSSDSEIDRCIGHAESIDEFRSGKRGDRKGKALCLKTNMKGETPLHVASINGDLDHVVKLIEILGHPVNVADGAGWLPIHEAAFHDRTEVAIYLLDRGARLDDTGCPSDVSTPLFEAIHNGSLATALVLVKRGANLWHRNKQGECLPELLDMWQPKRRSAMSFNDQRLLFDELLTAIRSRLGDDYDSWCNQPRSNASQLSRHSPCYSSCSSPEAPVVSNKSRPRLKPKQSREDSLPPMQTDVESVSRPSREDRSRLRGREDDLVDLDETKELGVFTKRRRTSTGPEAVLVYKSAMQAVAGSSSRHRASEKSQKSSFKRKAVTTIDADDGTWLVNDEISQDKGRRDLHAIRSHDQHDSPGISARHIPTGKCAATSGVSDLGGDHRTAFNTNHLHDTSMEFCPHLSAFTSTQLADAPSEIPPLAPHRKHHQVSREPQPPTSVQKDTEPIAHHRPLISLPVSTAPTSTPTAPTNKPGQTLFGTEVNRTNSPNLSGPLSVKVAFANMSLLVPVDDSSRSIAWLAGEAYRRRQILTSSSVFHPPGARDVSDLVRLSTRDGTLLLPTDRIHSVISGLGPRGSVVELLAELVNDSSDHMRCNETPVPRITQTTQDPPKTPSPVFTDHSAPVLQTSANQHPVSDKVNLITSSRFFKSLLESTRNSQVVDLQHLALGEDDCGIVLDQLFLHGVRTVSRLNLQGNGIALSTPECRSSLVSPITRMATRLTALDLSSNAITMRGLLQFLNELTSDLNPGEIPSPASPLPRLQILSLAHNPFIGAGGMKSDSEELVEDVAFISLIGRLITYFPKLSHLNLAGCWLGLSPVPRASSVLTSACSVSHLSELNLDWNPHLSTEDISTLLESSALAGLRSLTLRGCSKPETEHGYPTTLPLSPTQVASFRWTTPLPKRSAPTFPCSVPSRGDRLLNALSTLMSKGHFHLQTLDLGNCQLSHHCLDDLRCLFGTLGTSLTTVQLDRNPGLAECDPVASNVWCEVLRATALSASALVSLSIDLPAVNTGDDALSAAISAVEAKLLPGMSATPLQELVLVGAPPDWRPPSASVVSTDWGKCSITNAHRFCNAMHNLFSSRFGNLTKCKLGPNRVAFGIL